MNYDALSVFGVDHVINIFFFHNIFIRLVWIDATYYTKF